MKRVSRTDKAADLVRQLSGTPALPVYIRQLPASKVARLIDEVGLEDSHEIVAAMEAPQFRETMSIALWSSAGPGQDATLDVDRFVHWIALWLQDGDAMVSRRISELDEDLVVACFQPLLAAVDRTACGVEKQGVEIANYVLFPKQHQHWPRVVEAIVALWSEAPDLVLRLLRRCSHERSILNETADDQGLLREDLAAEREVQRAQLGHVSPMQASLFLAAAKAASLEALCAPLPANAREDVRALASPRGADAHLYLEQAIAALAVEHPQIASTRMRELAYLANVLLSGAESQGRGFTEARAARLAMATANLGAAYLLRERASDVSALVREDPGVVRLFQVGFNLLTSIPLRCCKALYAAMDVQSRRRGHVVHMEMQEILGTRTLTDLVTEGRYPEAKSVIDELSAVMDSAACVALRILIDPIPAFPIVLAEAGAESHTYVARGHRPIATLEDVERIGTFLATLADYCGN